MKVSFPRRPAIAALGFFAGICSTGASAKEDGLQIWISPGTYAYHFNRDKDLRDENIGPGVEIVLAERHALMGGSYVNSNGARSHYAGYQWRPLQWQVTGVNVWAGVAISAFDGYPNYRDGGWFVAPLPAIAVEGRCLGANFSIIPTIRDRLDGAFAIQLKLRVW